MEDYRESKKQLAKKEQKLEKANTQTKELDNTSKNIIEDYNDISNLSLGDKVIIPEVNE